ncbi:DDE-type integrase/transposase/recombinase [Streptomyces sp. NPDC056708]|uniref:DDE-type integrase/transposase/recombinase n=1 Tax=unclassified Streptomyces TaxID=2593676 RepID=UPI0036AE45F7
MYAGRRSSPPGRTRKRTGPRTGWADSSWPAPAPNRVWVADFTYVATWSGTSYVAFVVDTFSRRIVGWSAATNKQTPLVLSALEVGLWQRDRANTPVIAREFIHHSDAGSQPGPSWWRRTRP